MHIGTNAAASSDQSEVVKNPSKLKSFTLAKLTNATAITIPIMRIDMGDSKVVVEEVNNSSMIVAMVT